MLDPSHNERVNLCLSGVERTLVSAAAQVQSQRGSEFIHRAALLVALVALTEVGTERKATGRTVRKPTPTAGMAGLAVCLSALQGGRARGAVAEGLCPLSYGESVSLEDGVAGLHHRRCSVNSGLITCRMRGPELMATSISGTGGKPEVHKMVPR
jgi:hypothetical protein